MEKIIEKNNLEEAYQELKVLSTKLKDLQNQTPVFWYSLNLQDMDGKFTIFMNVGGTTKFKTFDNIW